MMFAERTGTPGMWPANFHVVRYRGQQRIIARIEHSNKPFWATQRVPDCVRAQSGAVGI
jgi:hypothetical protein